MGTAIHSGPIPCSPGHLFGSHRDATGETRPSLFRDPQIDQPTRRPHDPEALARNPPRGTASVTLHPTSLRARNLTRGRDNHSGGSTWWLLKLVTVELRRDQQHASPIFSSDYRCHGLSEAFVDLFEGWGRCRHRLSPSLGGFPCHTSARRSNEPEGRRGTRAKRVSQAL